MERGVFTSVDRVYRKCKRTVVGPVNKKWMHFLKIKIYMTTLHFEKLKLPVSKSFARTLIDFIVTQNV